MHKKYQRSSEHHERLAELDTELEAKTSNSECPTPGGGGGVAADHTQLAAWGSGAARETAPEPSDDEAASLITRGGGAPPREGGTTNNNREPSPSLTLETLPSTGRAQDTRHPRLQSAPRLYQAHLRKRIYSH